MGARPGWPAALLGLLLLVACQGSGTEEVAGAVDEPLGARLTLLSWNAQKFRNPRAEAELAALIERHRPDLVFVQEATAEPLRATEMGGHFARGWSYPWPGGATIGVLTLERAAALSVQPVPSEGREFLVTAPKLSLVTEHPLAAGGTLLAVNVHLLAFEPRQPAMLRAQLADLAAIMARHDGPIVMAGDFNTWSRERLALVERLACALGLEEVGGFTAGRRTADMASAFLNGLFELDPELALDRVYVRNLVAVSAKVLPDDASDHRPLLVTLELHPARRPAGVLGAATPGAGSWARGWPWSARHRVAGRDPVVPNVHVTCE